MQSHHGALDRLDILFVTQDVEGVDPLVESLRSAGANIVVVRTAGLALAYADRHTVDVLLVDLHGPEWWLTPEMRALRSLTRVPIYLMTEPGDAMPDATARVAGYFRKPVPPDSVIATLSALPRRSR